MKSVTRRWYDPITFNIYWFGLTSRVQTLTPLIMPLLVQQFVGESSKGTYLGIMRLWGLMMALLMQAVMGTLSDHSASRWGRRRPFMLGGTLGEIVILLLIGFIAGMEGMTGYWALFVAYILLMLSSNTAQAAAQGIIPDLIPDPQRGLFSGIKTLFEIPLPLIFVSLVIGKMVTAGNVWGVMVLISVLLLICLMISMAIPEVPLARRIAPFNWTPILRLALMTGAFTAIILVLGQGLRWGIPWIRQHYPAHTPFLVGALGLFSMVIAVGLGVWGSVRIGLGKSSPQKKAYTWWVINRLAFLVGATNVASFLLFFLQEKFPELSGEKAAEPVAKLVFFVGIFLLVMSLPSGWLSDRLGRKPLIAFSGFLAAAGTWIVIQSSAMRGVYIGGAMIGSSAGIFYAANWALGTDLAPKDQAGQYLGISNLAGAGAGAIGAYLGGPIGDQFGYTLIMGIYGMLFLLSTFALLKIKPQRVLPT